MAITGDDAATVARTDSRRERRLLSRAGARVQRLNLRDTWQVAAGAFLAVLGLVIILFAWYGAAHTAYVQQQIPYLVSGSFIGLGLMIVGGLLYWAHWLYRVYDQADLHHSDAVARQDELFERLIEAVEGGRVTVGTTAMLETSDNLVVTATGTNVHRADCSIVARHPSGVRRVSSAEAARLAPVPDSAGLLSLFDPISPVEHVIRLAR